MHFVLRSLPETIPATSPLKNPWFGCVWMKPFPFGAWGYLQKRAMFVFFRECSMVGGLYLDVPLEVRING